MRTALDGRVEACIREKIDLTEWIELPVDARKERLRAMLNEWKDLCGIAVELCFEMPAGFETAFGMYDPIKRISYLNLDLPDVDPVDQLLIMLHEFRHAMQNCRQELFSPMLVKGLRYVIQYDGTCYRHSGNEFQSTRLEGEQAYYTELYLAQPHERDANEFARDCLLAARNSERFIRQIQDYFSVWSPAFICFSEESAWEHLLRTYEQIDAALD